MWNSIAESARNAINKAGTPPNQRRDNNGGKKKKNINLMSPRNLEMMPADEFGAISPTKANNLKRPSLRSSIMDDINHSTREFGLFGNHRRGGPVVPQIPQVPQAPSFQKVGENFAKGWNNVVQNARKGVAAAQDAIEHQRQLFADEYVDTETPKYFKRSLDLHLDIVALEEAEVVYLTDRIVSMSHPALSSTSTTKKHGGAASGLGVGGGSEEISGERKLAAICHLFEKRHGAGNVMIWNLSEVTSYHEQASEYLEHVGPILAYSFPGSPAPPLGLWLQILLSLEKWLQASPDNVAVVHCLTGKGRTSTVLAAFLCWMGEAGFDKTNMMSALEYIAECKKIPVEVLTIPSQRRYAVYFTNMLEGIRPQRPPLFLKKIVMSQAPRFAMGPPIKKFALQGTMQAEEEDEEENNDENGNNNDDNNAREKEEEGEEEEDLQEKINRMGCVPYLQIFQSGQMLHTIAATLPPPYEPKDEYSIPFCQLAHGSITFNINQVIQGDILIRCRHLVESTGQKISMFRAALHTGYAPHADNDNNDNNNSKFKVLRFTKSQLDGACNDPRFPNDFFIDLILESCTPEQETEFYQQQEQEEKRREEEVAVAAAEAAAATAENEGENNNNNNNKTKKKVVEKDAVVSASTYDSMLHNDSRFWDVITEHLNATEKKSKEEDPSRFMGPTVGKRRVLTRSNFSPSRGNNRLGVNGSIQPIQQYSIGAELDFVPKPQEAEEGPAAAEGKLAIEEAQAQAEEEKTTQSTNASRDGVTQEEEEDTSASAANQVTDTASTNAVVDTTTTTTTTEPPAAEDQESEPTVKPTDTTDSDVDKTASRGSCR